MAGAFSFMLALDGHCHRCLDPASGTEGCCAMPTLILSISGARGIVGDGLDERVAFRLASAFVAVTGPGPMLIGRDSRLSGPRISRAAAMGMSASGCSVCDLGIVPTPTVQVAVESTGARGGIIVTASHNPPEWNALKFVSSSGIFLDSLEMQRFLQVFHSGAQNDVAEADPSAEAVGTSPRTQAGAEAIAGHIRLILEAVEVPRIRAAGLKAVVDTVHGAGSVLLQPLLESLGVTAGWIDREPDGALPPQPEPRAERLEPLLERVREEDADVGFAVDPDADRCAVVTPEAVLGEEWSLPLAALTRLQQGMRGPIVTNLSTSSRMDHLAGRFGVPLLRTRVGEAHVVARMREADAVFGGEGNGGVIDPRVHLGRDSGVAVALLLELEAAGAGGRDKDRSGIQSASQDFPPRAMLKRKFALEAEQRPLLWTRLREVLGHPGSEEDGLRWSWEEAWLHVRPSGTEPVVRAIAEAASGEEAARLVEAVWEQARRLGAV